MKSSTKMYAKAKSHRKNRVMLPMSPIVFDLNTNFSKFCEEAKVYKEIAHDKAILNFFKYLKFIISIIKAAEK